jgi:hypothetical protein
MRNSSGLSKSSAATATSVIRFGYHASEGAEIDGLGVGEEGASAHLPG